MNLLRWILIVPSALAVWVLVDSIGTGVWSLLGQYSGAIPKTGYFAFIGLSYLLAIETGRRVAPRSQFFVASMLAVMLVAYRLTVTSPVLVGENLAKGPAGEMTSGTLGACLGAAVAVLAAKLSDFRVGRKRLRSSS